MQHAFIASAALACLAITSVSPAQVARSSVPPTSANYYIVPQCRAFAISQRAKPVRIESVRADIRILEQTARTSLEIVLRNPSGRQEEAILLLPVPADSAVSAFSFLGGAKHPTARLLSRKEARQTYDRIVRKLRDPALLEFAGHRLIRSSVFPVPAHGIQKLRLSYEHVLAMDGERVDYSMPRSESLEGKAVWDIKAQIRSKRPISMVYSPSHDLVINRKSDHVLEARLNPKSRRDPGTFRLSYLLARGNEVTASLFAYPDPKVGGGYFLLMAGLPTRTKAEFGRIKREVSIVFDRSGSMAGKKMDQARAAALQVIEGLGDLESFNIIDYSTTVESFRQKPVTKTAKNTISAREYLAGLRPGGGTNIHDAISFALRQEPRKDSLSIILFLTDGLPTVGNTNEAAIRALIERKNLYGRRVFTFGVGNDVNAPLLDAVADLSRANATYVQPDEDVEVKVAQVFRRLYGPVLAGPKLETIDPSGSVSTQRVREREPQALRDLFESDQLVVLGQYRGTAPLHFRLSGNYFGKARSFGFRFTLEKASTRNSFVPRLWASRRIAYLVDQIRLAGANMPAGQLIANYDPFKDPRLLELRNEIMRLSAEFGILSEYTSFLATEGTRLANWGDLNRQCGTELNKKAILTRSGIAAVNQAYNIWAAKGQTKLNPRNGFLNDKLQLVETSSVQQIADRAFFRRGTQWIEGRLIQKAEFKPKRVVSFGSSAYMDLLEKLVRKGRQGSLSLKGEILLKVDGEVIRVVNR